MKVVLWASTRPRCKARPASINSEANTMSTSPGKGLSAITGICADGDADFGYISM